MAKGYDRVFNFYYLYSSIAEALEYPVNSVEFLLQPLVTAHSSSAPLGFITQARVIEAKHFMSTWPGDASIRKQAEEQLTVLRLNDAVLATQQEGPLAPPGIQGQINAVQEEMRKKETRRARKKALAGEGQTQAGPSKVPTAKPSRATSKSMSAHPHTHAGAASAISNIAGLAPTPNTLGTTPVADAAVPESLSRDDDDTIELISHDAKASYDSLNNQEDNEQLMDAEPTTMMSSTAIVPHIASGTSAPAQVPSADVATQFQHSAQPPNAAMHSQQAVFGAHPHGRQPFSNAAAFPHNANANLGINPSFGGNTSFGANPLFPHAAFGPNPSFANSPFGQVP